MDRESYLDKDTYEYLVGFADDKDIVRMLSVNKKFSDDIFFERIMRRKYPLLLKFKKPDESYKRLYLRMITYIAKLQEEFGIPYIPLPRLDPEHFYTRFRYNNNILSYAAQYAAEVGNIKLVDELIDKGANLFRPVLLGAAMSGNINLVKNILGRNPVDIRAYNNAMMKAAAKGYKNIVQLMIEKGANDFDNTLFHAAFGGHTDIINFLFGIGIKDTHEAVLKGSAFGGHMDIIKMAIENGAHDFNGAMRSASEEGQIDVVKFMIEKGANDFNGALTRAGASPNKEIISFLVQQGANNFNTALLVAVEFERRENVNLLINLGATNLNEAMLKAAERGYNEILSDLVDRGANDFNIALRLATSSGQLDTVKYLLQKGATDIEIAIGHARLYRQHHVLEYLLQTYH